MTFEKVAKLLADYKGTDVSAVTPESGFAELGLDSLDTVELVMNLEEEFGITIEMSEDIKTVGDLVRVIDAAKEQK